MFSRIFKVLVLSGFLICNLTVMSFSESLEVSSKISDVTVYPDSARVTRTVNVNLSKGEHSIILEGVVPRLDESSLTVSGQGKARVKIYGAYLKKEFFSYDSDPRTKEIQDQIQSVDDKIRAANNGLAVLKKKEGFLNSLNFFGDQQMPKELKTSMPSTENLTATLDFIAKGFKDVEEGKEVVFKEIREFEKEKQVLLRKLSELRVSSNQTQNMIVVDVDCEQAGDFDLDVSYLVYGASWRPSYDARTNYAADEVELTLFGAIRQTTGEDWDNVNLTLSTVKPSIGGRMPYVAPWVIDVQQVQRRNMMKSMRSATDDIGDQYEAYAPTMQTQALAGGRMEEDKKAEMAYANVEQTGVSLVYNLQRPISLKSNGEESKFPVQAQKLKADFKYSMFPKAKPLAYFGSRVRNSEDAQLLAGQVNLFLEGDYVGKSSLDITGPGESFDLYLGVDENVKVKRTQVSKKVDDIFIGGIKSSTVTITYEYKLEVENYKSNKSDIILFEAMPVSQNDRIKVKILTLDAEPKVKDWQDRKGIWRWEFSLKPKEKKEIKYSYSVEYPRDMIVQGL